MKAGEDVPRTRRTPSRLLAAATELAKGRHLTPMLVPASRALGRFLLDRAAVAVLVLVGIVAQVVLMVLMWQLVDITLGIAELWLDLARKHLEITL